MARPAKYTAEQKKALKKFRNTRYYFQKVYKQFDKELSNIKAALQNKTFASGTAKTFQDYRGDLSEIDTDDQDKARALYYADDAGGAFSDDIYKTKDMREWALDIGDDDITEIINDICKHAGIPTVDDVKDAMEAERDKDPAYQQAIAKVNKAQAVIDMAEKEIRRIMGI